MSKRTKMLATLGLVIVIIGGVIFAWYNLSGKTEQGNSNDTEVVQVDETQVAEEEKFEWVDIEDPSSNPMIVSNPCNIYAEPREDATVLGSLSAEQTGTNIAYAYDKDKSEGGIHLGWNKVNFGGIEGYVSLMDVSYDVPMETDDVVAEEVTTEEAKDGVSETESIVEAEPKAEETKKEEAKKDEPKKEEPKKEEPKQEEPKKEEPQQQAETPVSQPEPQPAPQESAPQPAPEPAPQAQNNNGVDPEVQALLESLGAFENHVTETAPAGNETVNWGTTVE